MKIRKWLMAAVVLMGMTAALLPGISASAASVPTDGTGTVVENTTADSTSREFFTIKTADGNVFYIVVDKTKTDDNVYLLTPVTEDSLKALAESAAQKNGTTATSGTSNILGSLSGSSGTSGTTGTATASATTDSGTSTAAKTQKATTAASVGNIAFIAIVAILVFAAAFYFKIYKPKHTPVPESFDEEADEDDSGEDGSADEDEEPPRKPASALKKPVRADQAQVEQEDASEPDAREPHAPAAPRPRREDARQENSDGTGEPEAEAVQPEPARLAQASTRASVGGLFAPDAPSTPEPKQKNPPQASGAGKAGESEEPEPEEDETEMDYGDGMDAFGNPDEEE